MVKFKTEPLPHQLRDYEAHRDDPYWGRLWEMGCGKSKPGLDEIAYLEEQRAITGALIVAPNGVHRNWVVDEIPKHLPDELAERTKIHMWMTSKASTRKHELAASEVLKNKGFSIAVMSYDAVMTEAGKKYLKAFFARGPAYYALDESPRIKSPGSKRTMRFMASSHYAPIRRICTGTIVDDKPLDVYAQIKFLNPNAWRDIGCDTFEAFRSTFAVYVDREVQIGYDDHGNQRKRVIDQLVGYKNLELLKEIVAKHGSRLRKEDVLDLPPKMYSKRYFEITPAQRRAYDQLRQDFYTFVGDGQMVSGELAITRMLRFQQITSGYLPTDDGEEGPAGLVSLCNPNPRLQLLVETIEDAQHQCIVWAKYRQDVTNIIESLRKAEISCVRYDGACNETEMGEAIDTFKRGGAQVFVSNPAKGGEGLTLVNAKTMVYFNNGLRLSQRLQSEGRFHRIGQTDPVCIIDLCAIDSVDSAIIESLRRKNELAAFVQGDTLKEWI